MFEQFKRRKREADAFSDAEAIKKIFDYFGEDTQRKKLLEECHEYIEAMSFSQEATELSDSEIADLFVLALQFFLKNKRVQYLVKFKLARVRERIADGYYERNPAYRLPTPPKN